LEDGISGTRVERKPDAERLLPRRAFSPSQFFGNPCRGRFISRTSVAVHARRFFDFLAINPPFQERHYIISLTDAKEIQQIG
jgi:hypothetical protein